MLDKSLHHNEEIIGTLTSVRIVNDKILLCFSITHEMLLPINRFLLNKLRDCIDQKIGVLNYDGSYHIRPIQNPVTGTEFIKKYNQTVMEVDGFLQRINNDPNCSQKQNKEGRTKDE